MLSRVFTSSALLKEPSMAAHALNAIGLCAKVCHHTWGDPDILRERIEGRFRIGRRLSSRTLGLVVSAICWLS